MTLKPVEALALLALSATSVPIWTDAHDWYMWQGIFMGAAVGALLTNTTIPLRLWRLTVALLVGLGCAGFFVDKFGTHSRESIRFISWLVGFGGFAAAKAIEMAMPGAFKTATKASVDALAKRLAGMGVGDSATDRAADYIPTNRGTEAADSEGNSSDAR